MAMVLALSLDEIRLTGGIVHDGVGPSNGAGISSGGVGPGGV